MKYDNTNRGAIFKNKRKEKETHPDLGGELNVDGKDYYLNVWKQTSKSGEPYYSVSVKPKEPKEPKATKGEQSSQVVEEEIPF